MGGNSSRDRATVADLTQKELARNPSETDDKRMIRLNARIRRMKFKFECYRGCPTADCDANLKYHCANGRYHYIKLWHIAPSGEQHDVYVSAYMRIGECVDAKAFSVTRIA